MKDYDVLVVGGGAAGLSAALASLAWRRRWAAARLTAIPMTQAIGLPTIGVVAAGGLDDLKEHLGHEVGRLVGPRDPPDREQRHRIDMAPIELLERGRLSPQPSHEVPLGCVPHPTSLDVGVISLGPTGPSATSATEGSPRVGHRAATPAATTTPTVRQPSP